MGRLKNFNALIKSKEKLYYRPMQQGFSKNVNLIATNNVKYAWPRYDFYYAMSINYLWVFLFKINMTQFKCYVCMNPKLTCINELCKILNNMYAIL